MRYELDLPGFEGRSLALGTRFLSSAKLMIDGKAAPKGTKWGTWLLRRNDGANIVALLRYRVDNLLGDPVPVLQIGDGFVVVVPRFRWYEWAWAGLPLAMVFFGVVAGGLLGAGALATNAYILRLKMSGPLRVALSAGVSILAVLTFLRLGMILRAG